MFKIQLTSIFIFVQVAVFAQLSGVKTIGASGADYSTLSAAMAALNTQGVNGAVVFNIANGTYNEQITLNAISGASATNTITFQSTSGDSSLVVIQTASAATATNNFVMKLNGSKYVRFKKVTFKRTGTEVYSSTVELSGTTNQVRFSNCAFLNEVNINTSIFGSLIYGANGGTNVLSYYTFENNRFSNGANGIYFFGQSSVNLSAGLMVTGNKFENQTRWSMRLSYLQSPEIKNNIVISNSTNADYTAIYAQYCNQALRIQNNKVQFGAGYGIRMDNSTGTNGYGLISNNMVYSAGSNTIALSLANSGAQNMYYNSLKVGNSGKGLVLDGSNTNGLYFQNNVIMVGTSGFCIHATTSAISPFNVSNYNNFYFNGGKMGNWGSNTNISTLSQWITATNLEQNSINVLPQFDPNSPLYITGYSAMSRKGSSALNPPLVSTDIDGKVRNAIPDIGAHEFSYDDLAIYYTAPGDSICENQFIGVYFRVINLGNCTYTGGLNMNYSVNQGTPVYQNFSTFTLLTHDTAAFFFTAFPTNLNSGLNYLKLQNSLASDVNMSNNTDSQWVYLQAPPSNNWPADTFICANNSVQLQAVAGMDSYLWSTGANSPSILVDSNGVGYGHKNISVTMMQDLCTVTESIKVNFYSCAAIEESNMLNNIKIYPNPSGDGKFFVEMYQQSSYLYQLFSVNGRLLEEGEFKGSLDFSDYGKGLYLLRISNLKESISRSLIIQ